MARAPSHRGPIRRCEKCSEFGGLPGIAKQLRERYASIKWPEGGRSLETLLDKLDKGVVVWWRNRPDHGKCLVELLDLDLLDLGLTGPKSVAAVMEFSEFPGMPPLDLRRDGNWQLGSEKLVQDSERSFPPKSLDEWFAPSPLQQRHPPAERDWLCVADDLERKLLAKALAAASQYELVFTPTLTDAADRLSSTKPLIVVISGPGADDDFTSLALRPEHGGLLVIAPYVLPMRTGIGGHEYLGWERMGLQGRERIAFDLSASGGWSTARRWVWRHFPDWRARFLKWLERHFDRMGKDSLYSAAGVQTWLDRFDPQEEWFCTVSDLLSLCLGFESEKKLPNADDEQAGHKLVAALRRNQPSFLASRLEDLCLARWKRSDVAWDGALPLDKWATLMPPGPAGLSKSDLDLIAHGKTAAQRQQAADELNQRLQKAEPRSLLEGGLLKPVAGAHDFLYRSLVNLLIRDQLLKEMLDMPLSAWAWTCFDAERCRLVDAALDALPLKQIQVLANRVAEVEPSSLESIGASETIFYAIGRRIARGEIISDVDAFVPLARSVLARLNLDAAAWSVPSPWSRSLESEENQLNWISACWAWSLMPMPSLTAEAGWLFPGWSDVLPEPPGWLTLLWPEKDVEQLPQWWQSFFIIAQEWVKDLDAPAPDVPRILKMAYLVKAAHGGWKAHGAWWEELLHPNNTHWVDDFLINKLFEAVPQEAAKRLWPSYLEWEVVTEQGVKALSRYLWRVRRRLLESLPIPWAIDILNTAGRLYLASCPQTLPPSWRGPLLLSLKAQWETIYREKGFAFLRGFGPAIANELEHLLGHGSLLGRTAASLIWEWNARRAGDLLQHAEALTPEVWSDLFYACPITQLPMAIRALQAHPRTLSHEERTAWVKQNLPASGGFAQSLLALLHEEVPPATRGEFGGAE